MTPEQLTQYEKETCGELSCDDCNARREELIAALRGYIEREHRNWISVEDRMPNGKSGTEYIVHWVDGRRTTATLYCCSGRWFFGREFESGKRIRTVTHWMPLPEAPAIKKENT